MICDLQNKCSFCNAASLVSIQIHGPNPVHDEVFLTEPCSSARVISASVNSRGCTKKHFQGQDIAYWLELWNSV